jgi:DNA-binding PadR family transcriptional regulator
MFMARPPAVSPAKPLSAPVLHILLVLADGPKHGYAIKQEVERRSNGAIRLGPGTLYEAVQRLQDEGAIEEAPAANPVNGQEAQRRYYRLTDRGWRVLRAEVRRLGDLVARARANPRLKKELA